MTNPITKAQDIARIVHKWQLHVPGELTCEWQSANKWQQQQPTGSSQQRQQIVAAAAAAHKQQ